MPLGKRLGQVSHIKVWEGCQPDSQEAPDVLSVFYLCWVFSLTFDGGQKPPFLGFMNICGFDLNPF